MQIKRGTAPTTVEREIDVEVTKAEVIAILGAYAKRKFGTDKLRFEDIQVVASQDASGNMVFSGATLLGVEVLPLEYPEGFAPVKVNTSTAAEATDAPTPPPLQVGQVG
jgi:hypothetical protein